MIKLPDYNKAWEYENNFFLTSAPQRLSKIIAHYELFKMAVELPGSIVECGVFKGCSLIRFAMMRHMFGGDFTKKIIGFDIFGRFPATSFAEDIKVRQNFVNEAGEEGISRDQLTEILKLNALDKNVDLVEGDITKTVPVYVDAHPALKIALLNLDTDIYEPAVTIMKHLYPRIVKGGILILDDYGVFPGETKAVDDYFRDQNVVIRKFPYAMSPSYIVKD